MNSMFKSLTKAEYKKRLEMLNSEEPIKKDKKKKKKNRYKKSNFPKQKPNKIEKKPFIPYWQQLRMPEWFKRREEVFKVKGRKCSRCGATKNLIIHHVSYLPNKYAWEYKMKYYEVLCDRCHKKIHCIDLDKEFAAICS